MNNLKYIIAFVIFTLYLALPSVCLLMGKEVTPNSIVLVEEETSGSGAIIEKDILKRLSITDFLTSTLLTRQVVKNLSLECINFYKPPFIGLVSPPPEM